MTMLSTTEKLVDIAIWFAGVILTALGFIYIIQTNDTNTGITIVTLGIVICIQVRMGIMYDKLCKLIKEK